MKIMLIRDFCSYIVPSLHSGIGIIATMLQNRGYQVNILDNNSLYKRYSHSEIINKIEEFSPDLLGFNINTINAKVTYKLVDSINRLLKNPQKTRYLS